VLQYKTVTDQNKACLYTTENRNSMGTILVPFNPTHIFICSFCMSRSHKLSCPISFLDQNVVCISLVPHATHACPSCSPKWLVLYSTSHQAVHFTRITTHNYAESDKHAGFNSECDGLMVCTPISKYKIFWSSKPRNIPNTKAIPRSQTLTYPFQFQSIMTVSTPENWN
jgi:hypothetical protein